MPGSRITSMQPLPNPYEAPQAPPLAEVVPPADPAELSAGMLPCHACGQPVPAKVAKCPRCGKKPLYDDLALLTTAVLAALAGFAVWYWSYLEKRHFQETKYLIVLGVFVFVMMPAVQSFFKKLRRGRW